MDSLTPYTFGSMSLGRNPSDIKNDLAVVRRAIEAGVWFHSSTTYNSGFTFMVLRLAFDENRSAVLRMVIKSELIDGVTGQKCRAMTHPGGWQAT